MMIRAFLLIAILLAACGGTNDPCWTSCSKKYPDSTDKFDACLAQCDATNEARLPLSVAASHVYTITAHNAPASAAACNDPNVTSWCECGTNYTDSAARCNTSTEVLLAHIPPLGCAVSSATLIYQVTTWGGPANVNVRRILRPVTLPTMGVAGLCATGTMASWYRSGPEAWGLPGAAQDGTDRTATGPSKALAGNAGLRTESFDVTALVGDQCANGCVLAQYATGSHVNVLSGTVSLTYDCGGPPPAPVCGNGTVEGAEECDDGNTASQDGCSAMCEQETCTTTIVCE